MPSPITFGGLASGLDTQSIVSSLVALEGRKVDLLRTSRSGFEKKIAAYGTLATKLRTLASALQKIADPDQFLAHRASLSKGSDEFVTVSARGDAKVGNYQIEVSALAASTFIRSDGFADANADLGISGTLSLQVGATQTDLTIDVTNSTLNGIRDAINGANANAVATVVFDGTDYHLELRGKETGLANAVTVVAEPGLPPPGGLVLNLDEKRAAADAGFKIDGQLYTSSSNTIDDAIQGVTLSLLEPQAVGANPIQLSIAEDFGLVEGQLKEFVDAYNGVIDFLNEQSKPRASNDEAILPLAGESALRQVRTSFGTLISSEATGITTYSSLSSIGIKSDSSGRLALESTKLGDALADDLDAVKALLSDATVGIGGKLLEAVEARTDSIDGSVKLRQDAFGKSIALLDKRILRGLADLDRFEQGLRRRFAAMETLVGRLQSQGNALSAITASSSR